MHSEEDLTSIMHLLGYRDTVIARLLRDARNGQAVAFSTAVSDGDVSPSPGPTALRFIVSYDALDDVYWIRIETAERPQDDPPNTS